ncbi:MAG: 2-succinyl-6-hydroxy-2,4-cyclohexadiene-1-carboxylate synthase [Ignavibacteriales bacterium]|nr:2-succinyl-6-hydroxy-2,4-cyclohexadiene-1-carboxylate synthase [Ignavibacteriales bacterium]
MLLITSDIGISFETPEKIIPTKKVILFLHGFTGSCKDWNDIIPKLPSEFQVITIDLIGHGKSDSPQVISHYTSDAITSQIHAIIQKLSLTEIILIGYSMGGRAALWYTVTHPEKVNGLILESTTPGIIDEKLRSERKNNDERLAEFIEKEEVEKFVDYWMSLPLFASQRQLKQEILEKIRNDKLNNRKTGLANSLRGFGQGVMPHLWSKLEHINCNVLLITGQLDKKFSDINSLMASSLSNVNHQIVSNAGHNVHLEKPEVFVSLINSFIKKFS